MSVLLFGIFTVAAVIVQMAVSYRWFQPTANSITSFVAEHFIVFVLLWQFIGLDRAAVTFGFMILGSVVGYTYYLASRPYIRRRTNVEVLARTERLPSRQPLQVVCSNPVGQRLDIKT